MPDLPTSSQPPDASDPAIRPRAVASRHFRPPPQNPAAPAAGEAALDAAARPAGDEQELEQLTRQFKDLVDRRKSLVAEPPLEEETRVRRKPMPRSGNVHGSVKLGEPADPAAAGIGAFEGDDSPAARVDAPQPSLPPGFAPMAWKFGSLAASMFALGYVVAALIHRPAATPVEVAAVAPPPAPTVWRAATIEVLDQAVAADRAGDVKTALKLAAGLAASEPDLPGLTRYLAELQIRDENFITAENALLPMSNAGREQAQVLYLRALNAARQRHFDDVFRILQSSLVLDPLQADVYYQLAEVLRRQGKLPDAVNISGQALLRVRPGVGIARSTIALKLRLAQIEGGQTTEPEAALAEALKSPPVAPEWLFTAAALSLQRGDRTGAAEWLTKARALMPRDEFNAWVDDYFFRQHSATPELAAFRVPDDERRRRRAASWEFFIDP